MMPEIGLPDDVIVICPQTAIIAGSLLGLLAGHLQCICLSRQVIHKCLLSGSKCVICGGSESREVLSHTPTPCCLDHTGDLKRTRPHPAPNSWDHPGPSTCSLHHPVLSMGSECGWPSCVWPPCWRPLHLLMWVLMWPVQNILMCFSCSLSPHALSVLSFTHPSVCLRISSAEWALWAAWHAKAWACPLRNAYNIGVFLTVPNTAVSFAVFPPHQFQTKSLLDTKNYEVSLKPDLEPKSMCPSMSGTSGAHQLMPNRFQNLQLGQRCHHCSCPSLSSWLLFPNLELFSFHHIHIATPLAHLQPGLYLVGLSS